MWALRPVVLFEEFLFFFWAACVNARISSPNQATICSLNHLLQFLIHLSSPVTLTASFFCFLRTSPHWARAPFTRFLDHTHRRTTIGRSPLDEWSARHGDLYLTTHNTQQIDSHGPGGIRTHTGTGYSVVNIHKYLTISRSRDRFPEVSLGIFSLAPPDGTMCPGVDSASENEYQGFLLG